MNVPDSTDFRPFTAETDSLRRKPSPASAEETISLLDLMMVLVKHRWFIILFTIISAIAIVGFSLYTLMMPPDSPHNPLPNLYKPQVEVLLQGDQGGSLSSKLTGELGVLAGLANIGGSSSSNSDLAQWLLKGNTILDQVIEDFDIIGRFGFDKFPRSSARAMLLESMDSTFDASTGILTISYESIDPVFATEILNRTLELLEARFQELTMEKVAVKKLFLEDRLKEADRDLKIAQNELIAFQKSYGIIDISLQAEHILKQEAEIRAAILSRELELQNLIQYLRDNDPQVVRVRNEIKVYKQLLSELRSGFDEFSAEGFPQNQIPEMSARFFNLKRDLLIQETIYGMLRQQYETTKIDEADNSRKFQIVERAEVPELKAGPSRGKISIIVTMSAFMLAVMLAFVREYFARVKDDPEESKKLEAIRSSFGRHPARPPR